VELGRIPQPVFDIGARPGHETIERHGDVGNDLRHESLLSQAPDCRTSHGQPLRWRAGCSTMSLTEPARERGALFESLLARLRDGIPPAELLGPRVDPTRVTELLGPVALADPGAGGFRGTRDAGG